VLSFDHCAVAEHMFIRDNLNNLKENEVVSYTLSDIDPTQIFASTTLVQFANTNAKLSINHSDIFYTANWAILFDSSEHATKFVTIFKIAVEMCGGRKSSGTPRDGGQADGESLCRQAASAAAERFSKLPFLHDGATQWDYDYHYTPTGSVDANCFIWFRSAHREIFEAPGVISKEGLRFLHRGYSLKINSGSREEVPQPSEILRFQSIVVDKGTDTEVSRVFYCEVNDSSVHQDGSKSQCQTWEQLKNLVDYEFGIKYTGKLR
jgi:hypothetical protein